MILRRKNSCMHKHHLRTCRRCGKVYKGPKYAKACPDCHRRRGVYKRKKGDTKL